MQKKLIALAVAGLASTGAFAADTATVYGVADAYIGSFSSDGNRSSLKVNSGGLATSRLGFKGTEDLGNGLTALFVLEYRLDIDGNYPVGGSQLNSSSTTNGSGADAANGLGPTGPARQQMIGLTGGFGTFVAGRAQTAAYDFDVKYDILGGTAISSKAYAADRAGVNISATAMNGHGRANNAVAYISPSMSGLTLAVNYAIAQEESAASNATSNQVTAALLAATYENGPVAVGVVYDKQSADSSLGANYTDVAFGASYNAGVATVKGTYQTHKHDDQAGLAGETNKAFSLGVAVPVSASGTVIGSYSKNTVNTTAADDNSKSWTVAYTHGLSKRTTAYTGYQSKDSGAATNAKSAVFCLGLNHKF